MFVMNIQWLYFQAEQQALLKLRDIHSFLHFLFLGHHKIYYFYLLSSASMFLSNPTLCISVWKEISVIPLPW